MQIRHMNRFLLLPLLLCAFTGMQAEASGNDPGLHGARVAVYNPSSPDEAGTAQLEKVTFLLKAHLFDYVLVEDGDFGSVLTAGSACLEASDGRRFRTLVIPSAEGLSDRAWEVIGEFAEFGGKLLFWGDMPDAAPDCPKSVHESIPEWTRTVVASMPEPEIEIYDRIPAASLDYSRFIRDGEDLFILENISGSGLRFRAGFDAAGKVFRLTTGRQPKSALPPEKGCP